MNENEKLKEELAKTSELKAETIKLAKKETAREILTALIYTPHEYHERKIRELSKQYGVEVE